jgi:hypothetical protein
VQFGDGDTAVSDDKNSIGDERVVGDRKTRYLILSWKQEWNETSCGEKQPSPFSGEKYLSTMLLLICLDRMILTTLVLEMCICTR